MERVVHYGKTAKGTQRYLCQKCKRTFMDTKIMRGMSNRDTAKLIMDGWAIHYNFFRPHQGLKGKTPSEVAGMDTPYKSWADIVEERGNDK